MMRLPKSIQKAPGALRALNIERAPPELDPATRGFTSMFAAYAMAINKATSRRRKLFQEHFGRDFQAWLWSSYRALLSSASTQLARDHVLAFFGGAYAMAAFHYGVGDERSIAAVIEGDKD